MIKTRNIAISYKDINSEWAFRHLLGLTQPLEGGDTKIISPLTNEKSASFCIYKTPSGLYKFKDFSSSEQGDAFDLLVQLQALKGIIIDRRQALDILKKAYVEGGEITSYVGDSKAARNGKGFVSKHEMRRFNEDDLKFWGDAGCALPIIENYNVAPLKSFTIQKLVEGEIKEYEFNFPRMYGYYLKDGSLYTVYCPGRKPKFVRVGKGHILGSDQIIKPSQFLIYIKSLKDAIAFRTMGFEEFDLKVPDGETTMISKEQVLKDKEIYEKVFTFMDPDPAGIRATAKYKELYDLDPIDFNLGPKDLSDAIGSHGEIVTKLHLIQILL